MVSLNGEDIFDFLDNCHLTTDIAYYYSAEPGWTGP